MKNKRVIMIGLSIFLIVATVVLTMKPSFSAPEERILTIKNNLTETNEQQDITFDYLIELEDSTVNETFSNVKFTNGQATISLKPNEEISISFAADYKYKVTPLSEIEGFSYISQQIQTGELSLGQENIITYEIRKTNTEIINENDQLTEPPVNENEIENPSISTPVPQSEPLTNRATIVSKEELENGQHYVIFRVINGKAYILTGKGNAKLATSYNVPSRYIEWPADSIDYKNIIWEYQGPSNYATLKNMGDELTSYLTLGRNTSGQRPVGTNIAYVNLATSSTPAVRINNGNYYLNLANDYQKFTTSSSGASVYLARIDDEVIKVSFDASNGDETIYGGASEIDKTLILGNSIQTPTEDEITMPKNYNHQIVSWVDIDTGEEFAPGTTIVPTKDTVYYANYQAQNYNIGQNKDTVESISTNDFITTKLYDMNDLFNLNSAIKTEERNYNVPTETWSLSPIGQMNNLNRPSLGFSFFDTSKTADRGKLSLLNNRDTINGNQQEENGKEYYDGIISQGISEEVKQQVFNDDTLGVAYIGVGDYLYQFDEQTGYYYYDSTKNAASYNKQDNRFYVYNYTYGTSKSEGNDNTDFLPFNYMTKADATNGKMLDASNGYTNYWFAMESEINFYLPDDAGTKDNSGKYQNRGLNDKDMIFKSTGDDDIWIYVDNELVLDMGGVHDVIYGEINFSTGVATIAQRGAQKTIDELGYISYNKEEITNNIKIQQYDISHIKEGNHTIKIYYLERGASQSNMGIYFNVSDKYKDNASMEISKKVEGTSSSDSFNFHIKFDKALNGNYGSIQLTNGEGYFTLTNNKKINITGLPSGTEYEIIEETNNKYQTDIEINNKTIKGKTASGKLIGGTKEEIIYTNIRTTDENSNINDEQNTNENPKKDSNITNDTNENVPNTYDNIIKYIVLLIISGVAIIAITPIILTKVKNK